MSARSFIRTSPVPVLAGAEDTTRYCPKCKGSLFRKGAIVETHKEDRDDIQCLNCGDTFQYKGINAALQRWWEDARGLRVYKAQVTPVFARRTWGIQSPSLSLALHPRTGVIA